VAPGTYFPSFAAERSLKPGFVPSRDLTFVDGVCHRCNQAAPSLRYCVEMYGTAFVQGYGWYINQAFLKLGLLRWGLLALDGVCPSELLEKVAAFAAFQKRIEADAPSDPWARTQYLTRMKSDRTYAQAKRAITKFVENDSRQEFGFREVGEGWVSESILASIVQRIFREQTLLRHERPKWLRGLELDIFLPDLLLAFEYQGQQHHKAVAAWGGDKALAELQERDRLKARICADAQVTLIAVSYREPLTEEHVLSKVPRLPRVTT
jgi:hypothetical protein